MECLTDYKIQDYIEGNLSKIENAMIRDHLILCTKCELKHKWYLSIENTLKEPVLVAPPAIIEKNVMKKIYPKLSTYSSLIGLIAASFIFVITGLYILFDFANNTLIQAFEQAPVKASGWTASIIKIISGMFSFVYTIFKACNAFVKIIFNINLGVEVIGMIAVVSSLAICYLVFGKVITKLQNHR